MDVGAIKRFVDNVDAILADLELERADGEVALFLDTADVRGAALGMHAFYSVNNTFDARLFDNMRALVQALAASGHLGTFRLLPSHQAEFLSLINIDFGLRHDVGVMDLASQFWHDAGIIPGENGKARSLRNLSSQQVKKLVESQVGNATRFFKAVEAVRGTWQSRLKDWRRHQTLEISREPENISALAASELFVELKKRLDDRRSERPVNNFADALALLSLIAKADAFRRGETAALPVFYDATNLFHEVVEGAGCTEQLTVTLPSGRRAHVLRGTDYFVMRAVFRASEKIAESGEKVFLARDELHAIHTDMREILEAHASLPANQIAPMHFSDRPLVKLAESVQELSFFENVWLPYRAAKDTQTALRRLRAESVILTRSKLQPALQNAVAEVRGALQANAEGFKTLRTLWEQVPAKCKTMAPTLQPHMDREATFFRRTGLLHFAFPQPVRERIFKTMSALLSGEEQTETAALRRIVSTYFTVSGLAHEPARAADAELVAGILWIVDLDVYILRLLQGDNKLHPSLEVVHAAAVIRSGHDLDPAMVRFKELEKTRAAARPRDRADVAMGLAYLYYHLWNRSQRHPGVQTLIRKRLRLAHRDLMRRAVDRAREAYELLEKFDDPPKRVYVLNQMLYCMVVSEQYGAAELSAAAEQLRRYDDDRNVWQYRFDETLARYYETLGGMVRAEERAVLLKTGLERATRARGEAPEDAEVRMTFESLQEKLLILPPPVAPARKRAAVIP